MLYVQLNLPIGIELCWQLCFHRWLVVNLFGTLQAVIENIDLKQSIFVDLEKNCKNDCILATNTSTIDLNLVGAKTRSQDRLIGAHFFRFFRFCFSW